MEGNLVVLGSIVAALFSGGLLNEVVRAWREKEKASVDVMSSFYPTWQMEMQRLHAEIAELRADVLLLSEALREVGVDPLAVRARNDGVRTLFDVEEDEG